MLEGQAVFRTGGAWRVHSERRPENGVSGEFTGRCSRGGSFQSTWLTTADERLFEAARSVEDNTPAPGPPWGTVCKIHGGFALAKERKLHVDDLEFSGTGRLRSAEFAAQNRRADVRAADNQTDRRGRYAGPQFEAWLIALGRRDEVEKWKSSQEV
ncbi:MAG: hypothetical protein ACLSG5_04020 [Oscillospiraceae bacterium]